MAGHSRLKAASLPLAYVPAIYVFLAVELLGTWMPGIRRGMTSDYFIILLTKPQGSDLQAALDGLHAITLDNVADPHVAVILERHAAFLAGLHFLHFILEALQGR